MKKCRVCVGGFLHTKLRAESWSSHFHSDSARLFFCNMLFEMFFAMFAIDCWRLWVSYDKPQRRRREKQHVVAMVTSLSHAAFRWCCCFYFKFIALNRRMDNGVFFQWCPTFWVNVSFIVGSHAGRRRRLHTTQFFSTLFFFVSHFDKNSYKYLKAIVCAGCRS